MKTIISKLLAFTILILLMPSFNFAQVPRLGILSSFVVYTTAGAISSTGATQLTGNVGNKDAGAITGLSAANVNGKIYNAVDSVTTQCAADLQTAYNQLNAAVGTVIHPSPVFGNGEILTTGVYDQGGAGSLNGNLILDAQSDTTASFIFKIHGAFSTSAFSKITFINGASPCNIFWLIEGALSISTSSSLKGTFIVNNAAITISDNCSIEGRVISTTGAITFASLNGSISKGCVSNYWTGAGGTADWFSNLNWTANVPAGFGVTLIPKSIVNGRLYPIVSGGVVTVDDLTIEGPATLVINNAKLQISGQLLNTGFLNVAHATVEMKGYFPQTIPQKAFERDSVKNLLINNNITLLGNVNITGNINFGGNNDTLFTGGYLTLTSDSVSTAQLADITNNGINRGNAILGMVTIERFITAKRAWRLLSVPLAASAAPSINSSWQEGVTSGNPSPGFGTNITGGTIANGFDQVLNDSSSIKTFNNASNAFIDLPSFPGTNTNISNYPAYFLFVRGDRSTDLSAGENAALTNTTLRMKGNINTDSILLNVAAQNFTLAGNPFPAAVDFHSLNKNNVNDKLYLWDPKLAGAAGSGGYVTLLWNGISYDITAAVSAESQFIPSGAAFLIESLDGLNPGLLQFKETDKKDSGSDAVFRPMDISQKLTVNLLSVNPGNTTSLLDGVITSYSDQSSNSVDRGDAVKILNPSENIGLERNGTALAIERRLATYNLDTIFLNLSSLKMQDYKLQINAQNFASTSVSALLKDSYSMANNNTVLNMSGLTEINFTANTDAASTAPDRFGIILSQPVPTPVKFYQFNASAFQKDVQVNFKTATESGVRYYEIQKSIDGINFNTIAKLPALSNNGGSASYAWLDVNGALKEGNFYYRVRSIEITAHSDYSVVVKLSINKLGFQTGIVVLGNVDDNASIKLQFNNIDKGLYVLELYNLSGQLIKKITINHNGGYGAIYFLNVNNTLAPGKYQIRLWNRSKVFTTSFLKR